MYIYTYIYIHLYMYIYIHVYIVHSPPSQTAVEHILDCDLLLRCRAQFAFSMRLARIPIASLPYPARVYVHE